jgi:hypothetical protein
MGPGPHDDDVYQQAGLVHLAPTGLGVPIPALACGKCGTSVLTEAVVERAAGLFEQHSADAWYELPTESFVPTD